MPAAAADSKQEDSIKEGKTTVTSIKSSVSRQAATMSKQTHNMYLAMVNAEKRILQPETIKLDANTINEEHWACTNCQNKVSIKKSRCGKCHRWRGGKRKGGWKIKVSEVDYSGIEWDKDWTCCEVMISATKKRCGKCHGWRGGKRVASKKQKNEVVDEDRHDTQEEVIKAKQQIMF